MIRHPVRVLYSEIDAVLTKILFTMAVIVLVGMIFKSQGQEKPGTQPAGKKKKEVSGTQKSLAPRSVAYLLVGLLIVVSGVIYYFNWSDARQIVTLRVINAGGNLSEYQAYRKDIKGREFTSVDGFLIQLADSDRLEIMVRE